MRVNQIKLNGLTFQYREAGEASAPVIVALHALGMSAESWDEVAVVIRKGISVFSFRSKRTRWKRESWHVYVWTYVWWLASVCKCAEIRALYVNGSLYGWHRLLPFSETFPSRVKRLIVEDTPPPFTGEKFEIPSKPPGSLPFDWEVVPSILQQLNNPNPKWWGSLTEIIAPTLIIGGGSSHILKISCRKFLNVFQIAS